MFDKIFSISVLIIISPLLVVVALLIILNDGFPVIFQQNRVGKDGKFFKMYKFRSMVKNAEEILKSDQELYERYVKNDFKLSAQEDIRILPFGNFIRKTSIDELPQFFNVLKGEMSVVGPRPVVGKELDILYNKNSKKYRSVKPGVTGLWQASGRSNLSGEKRVQLELEGIEKKSLKFDIYIIFKTILQVLKRTGAH
tara:strand:- start:2734 stop:3324 length:591 start_codon:yes stop_codon:yes gene_type:complete